MTVGDVVRVRGFPAVACVVVVTTPTEFAVRMVGDDTLHFVRPEACEPLGDDEFCESCGQIGCGC